jgi:hypothetical protein
MVHHLYEIGVSVQGGLRIGNALSSAGAYILVNEWST